MTFLFYLFSVFVLYGAFGAVVYRNLVVCALHLAGSMLALAGLFFILGAHFLAAVQVIVYAGAVMVLFVMVVMLFDLKKEDNPLFTRSMFLKTACNLFLAGLIAGGLPFSLRLFQSTDFENIQITSTKNLASLLFSKYIFLFEVIGVLLLLIAVGVVVLCRDSSNTTRIEKNGS